MSDTNVERKERKKQARVLEYKKVDAAGLLLGLTREEIMELGTVVVFDKLSNYFKGLSEEELASIPEEDKKWASLLVSHCRMANRHGESGCSMEELIEYMVCSISGDYQYSD